MSYVFNWNPAKTIDVRRKLAAQDANQSVTASAPSLLPLSSTVPALTPGSAAPPQAPRRVPSQQHGGAAAAAERREPVPSGSGRASGGGLKGSSADGVGDRRRRRHRQRGEVGGAGAAAATAATASHAGRPPSPSSWLRDLRAISMKPIDCEGSSTMHREFWYHPRTLDYPLGRITLPTDRGSEAAQGRVNAKGIGTRTKEYGSLASNYGQAEKDLMRYHKLKELQGAKSEPLIFITELNRKKQNPSMVSAGVIASSIGGTTTALKHTLPDSMKRDDKRQIGLYEDSWKSWDDSYRPAKYALSTSDVTQFADAAVAQKNLMRK
eukprot:TRINITY_DN45723_c0_g1_i1.p1 TRINITY_DN45723_c0_g1~~TRINITY_DN45723_c0_g1_i1.p1  ORF type:complete len:323 (+),score=69.42 TRINITY_DN45723_c0_g1_i1:199-1167(+)